MFQVFLLIVALGQVSQTEVPAVGDVAKIPQTLQRLPLLECVGSLNLYGQHFLGSQCLCADSHNVVLVSDEGNIYVLTRAGHLIRVVAVGEELTAVAMDATNIYVVAGSGKLRFYNRAAMVATGGTTPQPTKTVQVIAGRLNEVVVSSSKLYVALWQGRIQVDSRVYLSSLNPSDQCLELNTNGVATGKVYGPAPLGSTAVYNKSSTSLIASSPNPGNGYASLCKAGSKLTRTTPGYWYGGIGIYGNTLSLQHLIDYYHAWVANVVANPNGGNYLLAGSEASDVWLYDTSSQTPDTPIATLVIREWFGYPHYGGEDWEVRALHWDGLPDQWAFMATNNADPAKPNFFLFKVRPPS